MPTDDAFGVKHAEVTYCPIIYSHTRGANYSLNTSRHFSPVMVFDQLHGRTQPLKETVWKPFRKLGKRKIHGRTGIGTRRLTNSTTNDRSGLWNGRLIGRTSNQNKQFPVLSARWKSPFLRFYRRRFGRRRNDPRDERLLVGPFRVTYVLNRAQPWRDGPL